jgi:hypothetical protein
VEGLVRKVRQGRATGFRENQAFVGILTAQAWYDTFVTGWQQPAPLNLEHADVILRAPIEGAVAQTGVG